MKEPSPPDAPTKVIVAIFALQIVLLTIGITRDYQLKHEDNNALHATFARSHLHLGLKATRAQNYFYNPRSGSGSFYSNHPPGPGLVLAVVYGITGHDGPTITRAVAIGFHVLGTWLFYGLLRRVLRQRWELLVAMVLYVVLPESAFFGRMMNHEVLVLPATILLVRGYWESAHGTWSQRRSMAAIVIGALCAAISGWAGFFAIGACALHAGWEVLVRRNPRATPSFVVLLVAGPVLFALAIAHLLWILGGDLTYLRGLLASRSGGEAGIVRWLGRIIELHWRYFGLTSAVGVVALAYRAARRRSGDPLDPAQEVGLIFLLAGAGYVAVFKFTATIHDYWQFLLLPSSALGIVLLMRSLIGATAQQGRRWLRRTLVTVAVLDIVVVTTVTLVQRHVKREGYCLEVVEQLRRNSL